MSTSASIKNKYMKTFYVNTAKIILLLIFIFYISVTMLVLVLPSYKNIFTLVSCLSTLFTLALCGIYSFLMFSRERIFDSFLQVFAFAGMLFVYSLYLVDEFHFISTSFNYIALGFDFFTSLFSFLIIRNFSWSSDNVRSGR